MYLNALASPAYPDSVRRVNPPRMTIPNTLAALPNNQYATRGLETWGKELSFAFVADAFAFVADAFACRAKELRFRPKFAKGEDGATVDCDRKALRKAVCPMDLYCGLATAAGEMRGIAEGFCTQSLQVKKCRESLGAALLKSGIKDVLDAMLSGCSCCVVSAPGKTSVVGAVVVNPIHFNSPTHPKHQYSLLC